MVGAKLCSKCKKYRITTLFSKSSQSKDGLKPACKSCYSIQGKEYTSKNREAIKEKHDKYIKENRDKDRKAKTKWRVNNRDKANAAVAAWAGKNKDKCALISSNRRAEKTQSTPKWANKKYMMLFYKGAKIEEKRTGKKVHVDHIYPLNSDVVCGLHCEDNMQLLFARDNIVKSNKLIEV